MALNRYFFKRNPEIVACELLGKVLVRRIANKKLRAKIVETEAYFDKKDPASRACRNGDICNTMKMNGGTILIFNVHNNWLLNFVTGREGDAEAVLIRAIEPINFDLKCNGPGLLTRAMNIGKEFHKQNIFDNNEIWLEEGEIVGINNVGKSFRIGVRKDLERPLRFYIGGNKFVSRL